MRRTVEIGSKSLEVELLPELGGRLHRLRAFGHDLLRTPDDPASYDREPFFWGAFVMAPWCNRIPAGELHVGQQRVALDANFADGTAIHGQVQAHRWRVRDHDTLHVTGGGDGWPWAYEVTLRPSAAGTRLTLALALTNHADDPMPAGLGFHPWFVAPLEIAVPARLVFPSNTGRTVEAEPVDGPFDLRALRPMPTGLDATWTALAEPELRLRWQELGVQAKLRITSEGRYLCAASLPEREAVAVEPQTHAPDGLGRLLRGEPGGLQLLAPGDTLRLGIVLDFSMTDTGG